MSILSHVAKNSLDSSLALFHAKNLYHNTRLLEGRKSYIDFWYSKPLYGKVDAYMRLVQPSSLYMEEINTATLNLSGRSVQARGTQGKEDVLALNFVADAFKAMSAYMRDLEHKGNLNKGTFFYPLEAKKGYQGASAIYNRNMEALYSLFINSYVFGNLQKVNKQIRTFDDYVPHFQNFLNSATEQGVVITKSGLMLNMSCPHSISGLVIEIADERDFSDDMRKYKNYFNKRRDMVAYLDIATKFGFYVDQNAPWRLVANLASPAWEENPILKEIIDKHFPDGYSVDAVFENFYSRPYVADVPSLKTIMMQFYNSLVEEHPTFHTSKVCRQINEVRRTYAPANAVWEETVKRRRISLEELNQRYDDSFWISLYAQVRFREMRLDISEHEVRHYLNQIKHKTKSDGYIPALEYIEDELTSFLGEQMSRFLLSRQSEENLLTSGQAPDIIF